LLRNPNGELRGSLKPAKKRRVLVELRAVCAPSVADGIEDVLERRTRSSTSTRRFMAGFIEPRSSPFGVLLPHKENRSITDGDGPEKGTKVELYSMNPLIEYRYFKLSYNLLCLNHCFVYYFYK